ncbi:hypothetical protein RB601_004000 [Gaeumannomyces tritici]
MSGDISALSQYQIRRFFKENTFVLKEQCNEQARRLAGRSVTPTPSQGGTSYTLEGGDLVVQFRAPNSPLDMGFLPSIKQAYGDFVPSHTYHGSFGSLIVYSMSNMGGHCMYLARTELQKDGCHLLRSTLDDLARFFASAYHNTPADMARPGADQLFSEYKSQLRQLREGLPRRFRSKLDTIISQLPILFDEGWPVVPHHTNLLDNNIHVVKSTGRMSGVCGWRGAVAGPFGLSLGGVETMLGVRTTSGDFWRYHDNHEELRDHFYDRFYHHVGNVSDVDKQRIEVARLVGLFLANGFWRGRPATENSEDLRFLGAVVLR